MDYDLASNTTYIVCVNFYVWVVGAYGLKSTPTDKIFERLFMAILFTLRVFARNLLRASHEDIFLYFRFDV